MFEDEAAESGDCPARQHRDVGMGSHYVMDNTLDPEAAVRRSIGGYVNRGFPQ